MARKRSEAAAVGCVFVLGFRPPTSESARDYAQAAKKNRLRLLRSHADGLLRPKGPPRARSVLRRHADTSGIGGAAGRLPPLWQGEARTTRLSGGQSALH